MVSPWAKRRVWLLSTEMLRFAQHDNPDRSRVLNFIIGPWKERSSICLLRQEPQDRWPRAHLARQACRLRQSVLAPPHLAICLRLSRIASGKSAPWPQFVLSLLAKATAGLAPLISWIPLLPTAMVKASAASD